MSKDAYDVNTNTSIARANRAGGVVEGIMSGATNDLKERAVDWERLGLDPEIHGSEVQRLADMIVNDNNFDPSTYGTVGDNDESRANTERLLSAVLADNQEGATKGIMEIIDITKEFSRNAISAKPKTFWGRLIGKASNTIEDVRQKYDTVDERVNSIVAGLGGFISELEVNSETARKLEESNIRDMHATALKIAAGEVALNILVKQMNAVDENGNRLTYSLQDHQRLHSLDKRLTDLKLSQVQREQMVPQYQMVISNNDTLADKFRSVGSQIVPAWRNTISMALTVQRQQQATDVINTISNAHNELMIAQSAQLKKATIDVARSSESSLIKVETLKIVQDNLEESMTAVLKIQQEGSQNRHRSLKEIEDVQRRVSALTTSAVNDTVQRVIKETSAVNTNNVVNDVIDNKVNAGH